MPPLYRLTLATLLATVAVVGCTDRNGRLECRIGAAGSAEYEATRVVADAIEAGYPDLNSRWRPPRDQSHTGPIFYTQPGCVPALTFYEVTKPSDIALIETISRQALAPANLDRVRLVFYERQEFVNNQREQEQLVYEVTIHGVGSKAP